MTKFLKSVVYLALVVSVLGCKEEKKPKEIQQQVKDTVITQVASFKGQQVTGLTVSQRGRVFANFPRWREHVTNSVVEVLADGTSVPYPNTSWNAWKVGEKVKDSMFVAVQSVVADQDYLYVLDTRNALWKGVIDAPRMFVFSLQTNQLIDILMLDDKAYKSNSYTNDLRIDHKHNCIYITDSNEGAIIVYNITDRSSRRVLDNHISTQGETSTLTINGDTWGNKPVHSDGIALHPTNGRLYYHSLTGYTLYSVATEELAKGTEQSIAASVIEEGKTGAPDGMIFDAKGNLYLADLEQNAITYLTPSKEMKTLVSGNQVRWADTFSIYDGYLYYTNSRINEVQKDISDMLFTINKVALPE